MNIREGARLMPLDLTNLTTQQMASKLRGAKIISALPLINGWALELELPNEQRVSVSFSVLMTPNGPCFNATIQEI